MLFLFTVSQPQVQGWLKSWLGWARKERGESLITLTDCTDGEESADGKIPAEYQQKHEDANGCIAEDGVHGGPSDGVDLSDH